MPKVVKEQNTGYLTVTFYGKDGKAEAPSTVKYKVHDVDTGTEVLAETPVTPAKVVELVLTDSINTFLNDENEPEHRLVTVIAGYGGQGESQKDQYVYRIDPLDEIF